MGIELEYENSRDILIEINETVPAFKDVTYERIDEEYGVQLPLNQEEVKQA